MTYGAIIVETIGSVGLVRLNRPLARNALNAVLKNEVNHALSALDEDDSIGCVILAGSETFSAGVDLKELVDEKGPTWDRVAQFVKPIIAAVVGYALAGDARSHSNPI